MKITYMLVNRSGKGRRIPAGDAWQWIHHAEDVSQLKAVFLKLKKRIRDDRLTLANVHFEQRDSSGEFMEMASFEYKGPVIDDETHWIGGIMRNGKRSNCQITETKSAIRQKNAPLSAHARPF